MSFPRRSFFLKTNLAGTSQACDSISWNTEKADIKDEPLSPETSASSHSFFESAVKDPNDTKKMTNFPIEIASRFAFKEELVDDHYTRNKDQVTTHQLKQCSVRLEQFPWSSARAKANLSSRIIVTPPEFSVSRSDCSNSKDLPIKRYAQFRLKKCSIRLQRLTELPCVYKRLPLASSLTSNGFQVNTETDRLAREISGQEEPTVTFDPSIVKDEIFEVLEADPDYIMESLVLPFAVKQRGNSFHHEVAPEYSREADAAEKCSTAPFQQSIKLPSVSGDDQQSPIESIEDETTDKVCSDSLNREVTLSTYLPAILEGTQDFTHCTVCGKSTKSRSLFLSHMKTHSKLYSCHLCSKRFSRGSNLNYHLLNHTGKRDHVCNYCGFAFVSHVYLAYHERRKHGKSSIIFKCDACNKSFFNKDRLAKHITDKHPTVKPMFKCDLCDKSFAEAHYRKNHRNYVHFKTWLTCGICHQVRGESSMRRHMEIHDANRAQNISCSKCKRKFLSVYHLKNHEKAITQCDSCEESFCLKRKLKTHIRQMHSHLRFRPTMRSVPSSILTCNDCGKTGTRCFINHHVKIHIKPYSCSMCSNTFSSNSSLKNHVFSHKGIRNYRCNVCSKAFVCQKYLTQHMKQHGNKAFQVSKHPTKK